ncbi:hypothetical protein [Candidatus Reidiella endopervernicosa]|uniref:Uncharacterized protein n=1 Tax=Candidatus Reidiella endopervernicosa TaxID=2738883 RepID=A0A6N0HSK6_9GAMM|nr:hypothetical protein [Candidatus Reidiella endopervernicosa]QKQ25220.1 hypothetical protein HUE57_02115 [Candidatus Reidiella endopervernicosa]
MLFCPLNIVIFGWILWRTTLWIEFGPSLKFRTWLREEQLTWHDVYVVEIAPTVVRKGPIAIKYRLASLALEDGRVFNFRISNKDEQRLRELMKWLGRELVEGRVTRSVVGSRAATMYRRGIYKGPVPFKCG